MLQSIRTLWIFTCKHLTDNLTHLRWCHSEKLNVTILSAGFEEIIKDFLRYTSERNNYSPESTDILNNIEIIANNVSLLYSNNRWNWTIQWKEESATKAIALNKAKQYSSTVVMIGDGISDISAVGVADLIIAKKNSQLAKHCEAVTNSLKFYTFESFLDVLNILKTLAPKVGTCTTC